MCYIYIKFFQLYAIVTYLYDCVCVYLYVCRFLYLFICIYGCLYMVAIEKKSKKQSINIDKSNKIV